MNSPDDTLNAGWTIAFPRGTTSPAALDSSSCLGAFTTIYTQWIDSASGVIPQVLWVFPDESIHLQRQDGQLIQTVDQLKPFIENGAVSLAPPPNSRLLSDFRFSVRLGEVSSGVAPEDLLLDIEDIAAQLRGEQSRIDVCRIAVEKFAKNPSAETLSTLKAAYLRIPGYMRPTLLGMDANDHPVRRLLSGKIGSAEALEEIRASDLLWGKF